MKPCVLAHVLLASGDPDRRLSEMKAVGLEKPSDHVPEYGAFHARHVVPQDRGGMRAGTVAPFEGNTAVHDELLGHVESRSEK